MQTQSRELIKNSFMTSSWFGQYRFTLWLNQQNKLLSSIENRCEMGFCVTCLCTSWSLTESRCFIGIQLERLVQYNPKLITHNSRHKYYRHAHGLPSKEHGHLRYHMVIFKIFRWFKTNKQTIRAPVPPASHPCFSSHPNLFLLTGMDVKLGMVTFGKKNLLNIFICYGPRYVLDTMCCA